jgi:hypothetical protein
MSRTPYKSYDSFGKTNDNADPERNRRIVDLSNGDDVREASFPYKTYGSFATVLAFVGTSATLLWIDSAKRSGSNVTPVYTSSAASVGSDARGMAGPIGASSDDLSFTLARNGYGPLSIFTSRGTALGDVMSYKFLAG